MVPLSKHHAMKIYRGMEVMFHIFVILTLVLIPLVGFILHPVYLFNLLHSSSGHDGKKKNLCSSWELDCSHLFL